MRTEKIHKWMILTGVKDPLAEHSLTSCSRIDALILTGGNGDTGRGGGVTNFGGSGIFSLFGLCPNAIFIASAAAADLLYPYWPWDGKRGGSWRDLIEKFLKLLLKEFCLIFP
jgi:hypothetical protein